MKTRLTKAHGDRVDKPTGKIGGDFKPTENPSWLKDRAAVYDRVSGKRAGGSPSGAPTQRLAVF